MGRIQLKQTIKGPVEYAKPALGDDIVKQMEQARTKRFHEVHAPKIDIRSLEKLRDYVRSAGGSEWNTEEMIYQLWYLTEFAHTMIDALGKQQLAIDELRARVDTSSREKQILAGALLTHPGEPINHPPDWPGF